MLLTYFGVYLSVWAWGYFSVVTWLWAPIQWVLGISLGGKMARHGLTTHLHLVLTLRLRGSVHPFFCTSF